MSAFPPECADPRKGISVVTSWQAHREVVKASSEVCRVRYASHPFPLHHSIEKHLRPVMWLRLLHGLAAVLASANAELVPRSRMSVPLLPYGLKRRCCADSAPGSRVLLPAYFQLLQRRGCEVSRESSACVLVRQALVAAHPMRAEVVELSAWQMGC